MRRALLLALALVPFPHSMEWFYLPLRDIMTGPGQFRRLPLRFANRTQNLRTGWLTLGQARA